MGGSQYQGNCLRRGALQFAGLRGGLTKKMGVVFFRGVDTLMHTVKWNEMFYLLGNCHTNVIIN